MMGFGRLRKRPGEFENLRTFLWAFVCILPLCLLAYTPYISDQLLYDDIGILFYFRSVRQFSWLDCLLPLDNGFLRPLQMLIIKLIHSIWGLLPHPYHICMIIAHAGVAATLAMVFRACAGVSRWVAVLAGAAFGVSLAAFPTVYMISNLADCLLAIALLLLIHTWRVWLQTGRLRYVWLAAGCVMLAVLSKETGIMAIVPMALLNWVSRKTAPRRTLWFVAAVAIFCAGYGLTAYYFQKTNGLSYVHDGTSLIDWKNGAGNLASMMTSTLMPGGITLKPWLLGGTANVVTIIVGVLMGAAGIAALILMATSRANYRLKLAAAVYLTAIASAWPVVLLDLPHYSGQQQPIGRYAYTATALVYVAIGIVVAHIPVSNRLRKWGVVALSLWIAGQVIVIRKSPGAREFERNAKEWERFVKETRKVAQGWTPPELVTVYSGEPYGSILLPENYANTLWRLYLPDLLANYYSNRTIPESTRAYIFDGKRLTESPLPQ